MSERKGIVLKIHPAGVVLFAAGFLFADSRKVIAAALALLIHESAHLAVMYLCGMRKCTIEITPFGGMADPRAFRTFSPFRQALSAGAGIAASGCAALCSMFFVPTLFWHAFFQANLSLAMVNSLPAWPLDGARVLTAIAAFHGYDKQLQKYLSALTMVLGMALTILGLAAVWNGQINPTLLIFGPYLCYVARIDRISQQVLNIKDVETKLESKDIYPVALWASSSESAARQMGGLIAKSSADRYHMLLIIEKKDGKISNCCTETQWMQEALSVETDTTSV